VVEVARTYRDEAGLAARIDLLPGNAVHDPWPSGQDVVLLSYLLSALGDAEIDVVLAKARTSLAPGGLLIVHDFMLDDAARDPRLPRSGSCSTSPTAATGLLLRRHHLRAAARPRLHAGGE